ncbi:26S proteasome non-ATPase regulatory subunit 10 [Mytilus galloprovincialis]|nr:26S proteasome non-ATPase regulatory subunit 10 [Mytilus galloprovincialis]
MATSQSHEDVNFLRLAGLLIRVAPHAVRRRFDFEFHPDQLQQFLREKRGKIDDLTRKKKVITFAQYDLLYPRGFSGSSAVSSDMFDVSLMVCLLKNFTDLDIQDSLPIENIHTVAADISRIKFYRNAIVHSDSGKINGNKFSEIWNCVAEAILRLLPDLKSEIDSLISLPLTNVNVMRDLIQLEKSLETTNQHMLTMNKKMATLETEKNNIKEIQLRILKEWRDTDEKYIPTSATTFLLQSLKHSRGVIITGSPGCGKSAVAHHVALELEKVEYEIIACVDPSEIVKHLTTEKFQVFVIDDVCGKFSLNQQKADSWEQNDGKLNMLFDSSYQNDDAEDNSSKPEAKFIITCRDNIYVHKAFPKLTCFSLVQCSFSSDYKISPDEMRNIALSYLPINTVNEIQNICLYDFFPLICSLYSKSLNQDHSFFIRPVKIIGCEISEMKKRSEASFLCISLLVLSNNKFRKDELRCKDVQQLVEDICWDSKIESVSIVAILNSFERLKGAYIIESDDIYKAIHDKMFDIISAAIAPSIMKCLIEHVDIAFLANRTHFSSLSQNSVPFVIPIPHEFESLYLKRQIKEAMKGKYWEVFGSTHTENEAYRKQLLLCLKEQDTCQQISYVSVEDGNTPLYVSSHLGYVDFVEYFIVKSPNQIEFKDKEGRSSFYVACEKGHIAVVRCLMKYNQDINSENLDKTSALSATCLNGHTEVAKLLLDNKADINFTNKFNQDTLYFACLNGNVKLVKLLLFGDYEVDITNIDTFGQTALHAACQNGHTETVKTLIVFGMDVNQKNEICKTPLYLACEHGCYDTVKLIIGYISSKQISKKITVAGVLNHLHSIPSFTVLHAACYNGHTEVVNLLIDVGMNINDPSNHGSSALVLACKGGHYDTVKYLLALNIKPLKSGVETTIKNDGGRSALHKNGHIEVVKSLIAFGINLNDTKNRGATQLPEACQCGHYDPLQFVLDLNGQSFNRCVDNTIKNKDGRSALHAACFDGHVEIVKLLIDVGMNVNFTSKSGFTPLSQACWEGHYKIVKFLLELNSKTLNGRVDTTKRDSDGWSPLHGACFRGHAEVVKLLINVGMNVNDTTNTGYTPLYLACQEGHNDIVKYLIDLNGQILDSRVDTTKKRKNGCSALHIACINGHKDVVKLLLDVGMNPNDTSNAGTTPLYQASRNGHYEIVKYLLDLNGQTVNSCVDITMKDKDGWSVLHAACSNGHAEILMLLIDVGMHINERDHSEKTAVHLACINGHADVMKILKDNCAELQAHDSDRHTPFMYAKEKGYSDIMKLLIEEPNKDELNIVI